MKILYNTLYHIEYLGSYNIMSILSGYNTTVAKVNLKSKYKFIYYSI